MSVERVLIVNLTRFGDLLQTSPTVAALREQYPDAAITFLAEKNFADVCDAIPGVDRVIRIDLDRLGHLILQGGAKLLEAYRVIETLVHELRADRYDLALNFSSSRMSAVFLGLLQIPDVRGWSMTPDGFRVIRHPFSRLFAAMCLNRTYACINLVDYYRAAAGARGPGPRRLLYAVSPAARERIGHLLADARVAAPDRMVAFQLGASRAIRQWPQERFVAAARLLAARGFRIALIGGSGDKPLAAEVAVGAGGAAVDLCGRTSVPELGALLERSCALVTADTGPMHMAAAVGTPIVALFFGPASPHDTGPYGEDHITVHASVACAPCEHHLTCLDPFCRREIAPELVAGLVEARVAGDWQAIEGLAARSRALSIHRTSFDAHGWHVCVPLGGSEGGVAAPARAAQESLRRAYRATWLAALTGAPLPSPAASVVDVAPFAGLTQLAREGEELAAALHALATSRSGDVEAMERHADALARLDERIAECGAVRREVRPLTQMFVFAKENLDGDGVAELAGNMAGVYRELGLEASCMRALLSGADGRSSGREQRAHADLRQ